MRPLSSAGAADGKARSFGLFVVWALGLSFLLVGVVGCKDQGKISTGYASGHVAFLVEATGKDVEEVRSGLPLGAKALADAMKADPTIAKEPKAARRALEQARRGVQDLRIAKSTFFAFADLAGTVLRNDQAQDRMAGKQLFVAFPALEGAKNKYVETTGSMPEAAGVRAPRADGQWVAAAPVVVDGAPRALYVTGWSWASYAYRLEFALRSKIRSDLAGRPTEHEPLLYVFVVQGKSVFGAPVTPEICATTIAKLGPLAKVSGDATFTQTVEITGRTFGLSVRRAPALGVDVALAVLRSET